MSKKKIEQLYLSDLKKAFLLYYREVYVDSSLKARDMKPLWDKFWKHLNKYCDVVDTL